MKRAVSFFGAALMSLASAFGVSAGNSIWLNEVEIDPPVDVGDRCQYVELRGAANSTVAANTWFVSINSDPSNFGFLNAAVDLSGEQFGANGLIVLVNSNGGPCPGRDLRRQRDRRKLLQPAHARKDV